MNCSKITFGRCSQQKQREPFENLKKISKDQESWLKDNGVDYKKRQPRGR